jgi:hypothetical protein
VFLFHSYVACIQFQADDVCDWATCLHVQPKVNQIRSFLVQKIANLCCQLLLAGVSYCHDMSATANGASWSSSASQ